MVFPEYFLGRIQIPGPVTKRVAAAAAEQRIYVIVGCWEVYDDGSYANTALIFGRDGTIAGKSTRHMPPSINSKAIRRGPDRRREKTRRGSFATIRNGSWKRGGTSQSSNLTLAKSAS